MTGHRLREVWQDGASTLAPMPLAEIKRRAVRLDGVVYRRNRREYVAAAVVAAIFALYAVVLPGPLLKVGSLLIIAGTAVMVWQLARRTSRGDPAAAGADVRAFYRARLVREADMLARVGRWYIAPVLPGLVTFVAGLHAQTIKSGFANPFGTVILAAFLLLVIGGIWWINRRAAAALRIKIKQLDSMTVQSGDAK